jgi:hypothetical protein
MRYQGDFFARFKRSIIEDLLSKSPSPAQTCQRYNISSGLLNNCKKQCARRKFSNEPTPQAWFMAVIRQSFRKTDNALCPLSITLSQIIQSNGCSPLFLNRCANLKLLIAPVCSASKFFYSITIFIWNHSAPYFFSHPSSLPEIVM